MWVLSRPDSVVVLKDEKCKRSLGRYFSTINNRREAKFRIAKLVPAEFSQRDSADDLWRIHKNALSDYWNVERLMDEDDDTKPKVASPSLLDLKVEIAGRMLSKCNFCHHKCLANRQSGEVGFCGCGNELELSSSFQHLGEEPELVPSGTIFTCGCTMRCMHCQNWTISQRHEAYERCSPERLAGIVDYLRRSGCRNANLVGGDPTSWLYHWLQAFTTVSENVAVVWNSNSYYGEETSLLLAGFVDVYLLDFKYGPGPCAEEISSAPQYWEVATRNHIAARDSGELIIRVLVLPGHNKCCTEPIVKWISQHLSSQTRVNLMDQYRPEWRAKEVKNLGRRLTASEFEEARRMAKDAGLENLLL